MSLELDRPSADRRILCGIVLLLAGDYSFSGAVCRAVLVACNLEWMFPALPNVEH